MSDTATGTTTENEEENQRGENEPRVKTGYKKEQTTNMSAINHYSETARWPVHLRWPAAKYPASAASTEGQGRFN